MPNPRYAGPFRRGLQGFSLVELLVALVFTAVLMAGMSSVFSASVKTFHATNETIGAQRNNRWALELVEDDLSQAGMVFPERPMPSIILGGSESLFRVDPDQTVSGLVRLSDTDPNATEADTTAAGTTLKADVFQFFSDVPLFISGTWDGATTGDNPVPGASSPSAPTSAKINFTKGSAADLQGGDVMVILDSGEYGNWEHPLIAGGALGTITGNTITFETNLVKLGYYTSTQVHPGIALPHQNGVPVYFVRPAQLIRLSIQAISLDPSNSGVKIPCLVRQQASYPTSGTVSWSNAITQVVAENVVGFRVDMSFDGGTTWARTGASSWSDIQTNANSTLQQVGLAGFQTITDAAVPDWFRNISCLLRIDITTRTAIRREEYNTTTGSRAYKTRTQTLMISPRNFGVGR